MEISNSLLKILVCPVTGGKLIYDRHNRELISEAACLSYPIIDSIPILLADKARKISASSIKAVIEKIQDVENSKKEVEEHSVADDKKVSEVA